MRFRNQPKLCRKPTQSNAVPRKWPGMRGVGEAVEVADEGGTTRGGVHHVQMMVYIQRRVDFNARSSNTDNDESSRRVPGGRKDKDWKTNASDDGGESRSDMNHALEGRFEFRRNERESYAVAMKIRAERNR